MQFLELARQRYSVRAYKNEPVEEEKLDYVLNAMRLAPTAVNHQPFRFIILPTANKRETIIDIFHKEWIADAPLIICACGIPSKGWQRSDGVDFTPIDVAIATDHLILAATEIGLGTCWVASFDTRKLRTLLGIPETAVPYIVTPLGYPNVAPEAKERKPLSAIVRYNHW